MQPLSVADICERTVGILRRELLDRCIPFDERHLLGLLTKFVRDYYHPARTRQGIEVVNQSFPGYLSSGTVTVDA